MAVDLLDGPHRNKTFLNTRQTDLTMAADLLDRPHRNKNILGTESSRNGHVLVPLSPLYLPDADILCITKPAASEKNCQRHTRRSSKPSVAPL